MLSQFSKGMVVIDDGAVTALRKQNKSLLPAGITKVDGEFERGDIINILNERGEKLACGISNYNSEDIAKVKGCHSDKIVELLGYEYGAEAVHKNNLVLV
jgi:glutamate 5-kinase